MTGKLLVCLAGVVCLLASSQAVAARMLITPVSAEAQGSDPARAPGADDALASLRAVVSRAVESAALDHLPDVEVLTPGALEQKLELDLARACTGEGDDAACVVEFASALGVDWVLRPRLSRVGGAVHLTLSLYDGARPQLVAQASCTADANDSEGLLRQVPGLVVEVAKKARIPVLEGSEDPPLAAMALLGAGATGLALGAVLATGSAVGDLQYFDAKLDREGARTWESARLFAWGAAGACVVGGTALLVVGALAWE